MPEIPQRADLSTWIRDTDRRLRALETAPRATATSQPWGYSFLDVAQSTNSTTYVNLTTAGPTVTMDVGQTCSVFVTASAYITTPANTSGLVGLFIDNALWGDVLTFSNSSTATLAINSTTQRAIVDTDVLAEGSHTFQLRYRSSSSSSSVTFGARFLSVQPF